MYVRVLRMTGMLLDKTAQIFAPRGHEPWHVANRKSSRHRVPQYFDINVDSTKSQDCNPEGMNRDAYQANMMSSRHWVLRPFVTNVDSTNSLDICRQQLVSRLIDRMSAAGRKMFVYVFVTI